MEIDRINLIWLLRWKFDLVTHTLRETSVAGVETQETDTGMQSNANKDKSPTVQFRPFKFGWRNGVLRLTEEQFPE